jgi:hypothetical protein
LKPTSDLPDFLNIGRLKLQQAVVRELLRHVKRTAHFEYQTPRERLPEADSMGCAPLRRAFFSAGMQIRVMSVGGLLAASVSSRMMRLGRLSIILTLRRHFAVL